MNPLVFWNELAARPHAEDAATANARMDAFVDTLAAVMRCARGLPPVRLRMHVDPNTIELAAQHFLPGWLARTDRERRLLFRQLAAAAPLLDATVGPAAACDRFGCAECKVFGEEAYGCRAAWASDELLASLDSDDRWRTPMLQLGLVVLKDDGALEEKTGAVRHVARAEHASAHSEWFAERVRMSIRDGRDVWERRVTLFPRLDLCREVEKQLAAMDAGSEQLRQVVRRLVELNAAFSSWTGQPIEPDFMPSKCTPETPQTLKEEGGDHTFTLPDGRRHRFSWHVRYTPGGGRVFFDGDVETKRGLVGYVGLKKGAKLT